MLRALLRLALACGVMSSLPACPAGTTEVKKPKGEQPPDAKALLKQARRAANKADYDTADKAFADAYALQPDFDVLQERVDMLMHAGRATKGIEVAKVYWDANGTDVKGYYLYCDALLTAGRGAEALDVAESILAFNKDDPAGHEKKGRALMILERELPALDELRKARDLEPKTALYHISLGLALDKLTRVDEAQLEFRAAVKDAPDDADAKVYLGMALREQQAYDEAKTFLEAAVQLDPKNGRAYFELGRLYNVLHKDGEAEQALSKAVLLAPNESLYWYAYGEIFRVQSRSDEAIAAYRRAVDIDPPYPKALNKLGLLLVDAKQWDDAERVLTIAIRKQPKEPVNYESLGAVYAATKRGRAAIENYEKYLDLAPKAADGGKVRGIIQTLKSSHPE